MSCNPNGARPMPSTFKLALSVTVSSAILIGSLFYEEQPAAEQSKGQQQQARQWAIGSMADLEKSGVDSAFQERTAKRSKDPAFAEKVEDIVGLYMHPPAHAVVLSIDEKSQIQALDRTQPGLPLKPGKCGTMTHDLYGGVSRQPLNLTWEPVSGT